MTDAARRRSEHLLGRLHRPLTPAPPGAALDAVLLDRDGTLNVLRPGYRTVGDFEMLPGAAAAVARICALGIPLVLVTNQRGLATGALSEVELAAVHELLEVELGRVGGRIDDYRVCPHDAGTCWCRKPAPGLLEALFCDNPALRRQRCVFVGDADSDARAADAAGVPFRRVDAARGIGEIADSLVTG